jgi:hypothetical protein
LRIKVVGEGPTDLILVPGFVSHVEVAWEEPRLAHFLGRLAAFSRLIVFDKRGTGMSDPVDSTSDRAGDQRGVPVDDRTAKRPSRVWPHEGQWQIRSSVIACRLAETWHLGHCCGRGECDVQSETAGDRCR